MRRPRSPQREEGAWDRTGERRRGERGGGGSRQVRLERLLRQLDRPVQQRLPEDRRDLGIVQVVDAAGLRNLLDERRLEPAARACAPGPALDLAHVVGRPPAEEKLHVPLRATRKKRALRVNLLWAKSSWRRLDRRTSIQPRGSCGRHHPAFSHSSMLCDALTRYLLTSGRYVVDVRYVSASGEGGIAKVSLRARESQPRKARARARDAPSIGGSNHSAGNVSIGGETCSCRTDE